MGSFASFPKERNLEDFTGKLVEMKVGQFKRGLLEEKRGKIKVGSWRICTKRFKVVPTSNKT